MRELWRVRRAQRIRQREEIDRDVVLAWWVERISLEVRNTNKLLPFQQFLQRDKRVTRQTRQTPQQHVGVLHVLSEQYGIPLRIVEKKPT